MNQHVDIGERLLLPRIIQHGERIIRIVSEIFLQTVRYLQNPADVQKNPRGDIVPSGFPGGNAFLSNIDSLFLQPFRKLGLRYMRFLSVRSDDCADIFHETPLSDVSACDPQGMSGYAEVPFSPL